MRNITLLTLLSVLYSTLSGGISFAGSDLSATFTRIQARNASTGIDAIYYNPASLPGLGRGLFISLNSSTLRGSSTITSTYTPLSPSPKEYRGEITSPLLPDISLVLSGRRVSLSAGINSMGGGKRLYHNGTPRLEMPIPDMVKVLSERGYPVSDYSSDLFLGISERRCTYQANISFIINNIISAAAGVRMVTATDIYDGHIMDIKADPVHPEHNPAGSMITVSDFSNRAGHHDIAEISANRNIDAEQWGRAVTPLLSLSISPSDIIDIALRYHLRGKMRLTNRIDEGNDVGTDLQGTPLFPYNSQAVSYIPAMLAAGFTISLPFRTTLSGSVSHHFSTGEEDKVRQEYSLLHYYDSRTELGLGAELGIIPGISLSAGWLNRIAHNNLRSNLLFPPGSHSLGGGIGVAITPLVNLNIAISRTYGKPYRAEFNDTQQASYLYSETYTGRATTFAFGLDILLGL